RNYENKPDDIIIEIDPKMSFGTGEHQTTKLILVLLEKYIAPGIKVLDVGSGTGILAIASVKLGASYALGVDNDEWCRINGEENIERNGMQSKVYIKEGEIDSVIDSDFDLVLANINKNVLLEIKETLYSKCKPGGLIIISGILESDKTNLETEYTNLGLKVLENQQLDEWSAIVFQN
ncbi:MAG: 50S ribosomal protein L11 methyltransferase, partial [Melioribacteraceae bacterium]|nr:50S ribosomal protein L11 methyltransferase [Melioribacteraceae bacterium]